jgi:hypothetical protein
MRQPFACIALAVLLAMELQIFLRPKAELAALLIRLRAE